MRKVKKYVDSLCEKSKFYNGYLVEIDRDNDAENPHEFFQNKFAAFTREGEAYESPDYPWDDFFHNVCDMYEDLPHRIGRHSGLNDEFMLAPNGDFIKDKDGVAMNNPNYVGSYYAGPGEVDIDKLLEIAKKLDIRVSELYGNNHIPCSLTCKYMRGNPIGLVYNLDADQDYDDWIEQAESECRMLEDYYNGEVYQIAWVEILEHDEDEYGEYIVYDNDDWDTVGDVYNIDATLKTYVGDN